MKKDANRALLAGAGVALVGGIVVFANVIFTKLHTRIDCTENRVYSLSANSKRILGRLKTPVTLKFYCSKSSNQMPVFFISDDINFMAYTMSLNYLANLSLIVSEFK